MLLLRPQSFQSNKARDFNQSGNTVSKLLQVWLVYNGQMWRNSVFVDDKLCPLLLFSRGSFFSRRLRNYNFVEISLSSISSEILTSSVAFSSLEASSKFSTRSGTSSSSSSPASAAASRPAAPPTLLASLLR